MAAARSVPGTSRSRLQKLADIGRDELKSVLWFGFEVRIVDRAPPPLRAWAAFLSARPSGDRSAPPIYFRHRRAPRSAITDIPAPGGNPEIPRDARIVIMASIEPNAKNQHYVWQHYLNAWAAEGTFCCYRQKDEKLFVTQPKVVASETYFYETVQLTDADKTFLEAVISQATDEGLRKLNREYVELIQRPFDLRAQLKSASLPPEVRADLEKKLRWVERNLGECYHAGIENKCQDILDLLRNQNDAFYQDEVRCGDFLYFLSLQYFRTAKMRDGHNKIPSPVPGHDPRRTAHIVNHIYATNVAAGLFRDRKDYRIVFLKNTTAIPFIAGDQPVINMLDPRTTDDLELYYPLSPRLAMVLTGDGVKFPDRARNVTCLEVEHYNYEIYRKSEDQIYSNDRSYLSDLVKVGKNVLE